ncbi:hypothetical protein L7F22_026238 [Adiantum nelumboides]|nr:hypothetical protein [Adiantum nelumboides]
MSASSSGASQAFSFVEYVDTLISHKGLPYQEPTKATIRSHLSSLLQEFPCLHVKIEAFPHSYGRPSSLLLQVGGTIPILFLQVFYNIPIAIWLAEQYPFCAPLVFVVPSPFMIIKTAHPMVDHSGLVSCSNLRSWVYPTSNLVDLVRSLCASFGQDPPLYSVKGPTSMAVPLSVSESSTSALSTSASSLLGFGSLLQPPPPLTSSMRAPRAQSASPPLLSTSLLGPGSSSQRWPSLGHAISPVMQPLLVETRPFPQQHLSHYPGAAMANQQLSATSSSNSTGSIPILPSAQQQSVHHDDAGASLAQPLPSTSRTASLVGPGNKSQWCALPGVGSHMVYSQAASQPSGLLKCSSMSVQGQWPAAGSLAYDNSSLLATSNSTTLLGPGKLFNPPPLYDGKNSQTYLPLPLSASANGPGSTVQFNSFHSMGQSITTTTTTSSSSSFPSLLGNGPFSQWQPSHARMGFSMGNLLPTSVPGPIASALTAPESQLQQQIVISYANGGEEFLNAAVSCASHVQSSSNRPSSVLTSNASSALSKPSYTDTVSTLAQQRVQLPSTFSNPLLGTTDQPPDRKQNLMDALLMRMQCDLAEYRVVKEKDMLKLMDLEGLLKHRQAICKKGIEELQLQRENLETQLQNILINTDFLETWLLKNNKSNMEIDVDHTFQPCDVLSYQLLECTAADLALEDEIYCLDRAAQEGIVSLEFYLRLVRTLSREQFFQRALAVKVRAAQGQC